MATIKTFEELEIWQLSREICQEVWDIFERTTLGKDFELKIQMNRSSGSFMAYLVKSDNKGSKFG